MTIEENRNCPIARCTPSGDKLKAQIGAIAPRRRMCRWLRVPEF
ncbi:hypothetical protein Q5692_39540 [Microcoleus sp. C2C3]